MSKILLIDDDVKYQSILKELLITEGYKVVACDNPAVALDEFKRNTFDLVITDLIMDTIDGLQLVTVIKKINPFIPVIILTGHTDYNKELAGLDLDVDDYIYKPISFEVLLKRIYKRIKSKKIIKELDTLTSERDEILVECKNRKVYQNGERIELTLKEYELLCFFLKNKNQIFNRYEILENVWHVQDDSVDERTIDTHVRKLRAKMMISSIVSIRGVGYEWFE